MKSIERSGKDNNGYKNKKNETNINKNRDQAITRDRGKHEEEGRSGKEARQTEGEHHYL